MSGRKAPVVRSIRSVSIIKRDMLTRFKLAPDLQRGKTSAPNHLFSPSELKLPCSSS